MKAFACLAGAMPASSGAFGLGCIRRKCVIDAFFRDVFLIHTLEASIGR
jgi:hypothetical protein